MSGTFFDTNVLLYLIGADAGKANAAEAALAGGGRISVQVLNEFAAVARRKAGMSWGDIGEVLAVVSRLCEVEPLSVAAHDLACEMAEQDGLSIHDASIVATALLSGCDVLCSEDFQPGRRYADQLAVINPFA